MNKGEGTKLRTGCKRCTLHSQSIRCSHRAYTWLESLAAELREWKCESFECCMRSMGSLQQLVGIIGKQFRGIITSSIDATLHIHAYLSRNAFTASHCVRSNSNSNKYKLLLLRDSWEDNRRYGKTKNHHYKMKISRSNILYSLLSTRKVLLYALELMTRML